MYPNFELNTVITVSDCLKSLGELIDRPQPRLSDSGKGKENDCVHVEVLKEKIIKLEQKISQWKDKGLPPPDDESKKDEEEKTEMKFFSYSKQCSG